MVERMLYTPTTGYVRPFKKLSRFCPLRGRGVGVFNMPLQLGTCGSSKYRCNSLTGYVQLFKKLSRFRPLRGRLWGVCDTPLRPGMCCPSKNYPVFVSFGAICGAYAIRPYDRVCAALRKTVSFPSLSGPLVGRMRYAPTIGYVRSFEIPMRSPDRVCVPLRNICATPRPATCDPTKYRYDLSTGGAGIFGRWGGGGYRLRGRRA